MASTATATATVTIGEAFTPDNGCQEDDTFLQTTSVGSRPATGQLAS
jgi:hypothetical protein